MEEGHGRCELHMYVERILSLSLSSLLSLRQILKPDFTQEGRGGEFVNV